MALRKIWKLFVVCIIVSICFALSSAASVNNSESVYLSDLSRKRLDISALEYKDSQDMLRVSGSINASISAWSGVTVDESFTLAVNDTITYNCTYTPKSASVDFGFIAPDGYFYFTNVTTGGIKKTIRVDQSGTYTLAIMNNSNSTVTVTGTVNY